MVSLPALHRRLWVSLALLIFLFPSRPVSAQKMGQTWRTRPPISYFALTASLQAPLRLGTRLSPAQFDRVRRLAEGEQAQLRRLLNESQTIVADPGLSLEQKRLLIQRMGYNRRVDAILYESDRLLLSGLEPAAYARLVAWIEARWPVERLLHGGQPVTGLTWPELSALFKDFFPALAPPEAPLEDPLRAPLEAPRTYEIFATRYDAKGRYTAALPDQCVKLTNGGLRTCADKGYVAGQRYEIFMSYLGGKKGVGVVVAESGPWNIDDNFWSTLADPTPRRMFADLPLGMPEAQAAFYNGYNGGLDQYGRKVTAPFAIDLAFEVADDLGLPPRTNDWINVSFMWTDGWDGGPASGNGAGQSASPPPAAIVPVETAAYKPDGSQVHVVKAGQTLWAIALAYGTTIQRLRDLNGLLSPSATGQVDVILPGQELLVRPAGPVPATDTPDPGAPASRASPGGAGTLSPAARSTLESTSSTTPGDPGIATLIAKAPAPGVTQADTTPSPEPGKAESSSKPHPTPASMTEFFDFITPNLLLAVIAGLLGMGAALYLLGRWMSRP